MKKMISMVLPSLLVLSAAVNAEPPAKEPLCRACHGANGASPIMDTYPKLSGQNQGYLVSALKSYRAGERQGGMAALMSPQAAGLTDEEIDSLSAYYSSQQ